MNLTLLCAILVGAGCLALGYLMGSRYPPRILIKARLAEETSLVNEKKIKKNPKECLEVETLADILEDFKMVLVVRNDLKMGKGKIAAQCSHATLGLYKKLLYRAPKALNRWEMCAQPKVVVKIESEEDMLILQDGAKSLKLPTHITIDAGRTQIEPNSHEVKKSNGSLECLYFTSEWRVRRDSRTVMAILGPVEVVDDVTGGLKLL